MVAGFPLLRARRSAPSHIPWPFLDLTSVLSRCQILAWLVSWGGGSFWVDVYACLRHGQPGRASSFFRPSLRSAGGDGLHS